MIITAFNPETDDLERSFLSNAVSAGATSLTVKNNDRFAANDRVMVGEMGREKTEVVTVSAISGGTGVTVSSLTFPHSADDPVYKLRFDQVKFYRSTTGSAGAFSILTTQNLDVDNDTLTTLYDDTAGIATYYYKVSYYNSVSTLESTLSDPVLGSGYPRNTVGFMIDEILREVGDEGEHVTSRVEILGWFNAVNDDLSTRSKKPYDFLHTRATKSRTAAATTLDLPSDMWKFDRMDYVFTDTNGKSATYPVRVKSLADFRYEYGDSSGGDANDELQYIAIDTAVDKFRLWPRSLTTASNIFYIYYWKTFTTLDSDGDTFETGFPNIYKLYAMGMFYRKKAAKDTAVLGLSSQYLSDYNTLVARLKRSDPKDTGSPRSFTQLPQTFKGNRRF